MNSSTCQPLGASPRSRPRWPPGSTKSALLQLLIACCDVQVFSSMCQSCIVVVVHLLRKHVSSLDPERPPKCLIVKYTLTSRSWRLLSKDERAWATRLRHRCRTWAPVKYQARASAITKSSYRTCKSHVRGATVWTLTPLAKRQPECCSCWIRVWSVEVG